MTAAAVTPVQRDLRLDSLRGLMLVGMAVNHVTSPLHILTDHPLGYSSAAEGFVFLSGLVAGLVYTRRRERLGASAMAHQSRVRAATIYGYHLVLFFGLLLWVNLFVTFAGTLPGNAPPLMRDHPAIAAIAGVLLIDQPPLLDILPLYTGLLLLLPWVLGALSRGRHAVVLMLSLGVWLLTNLFYPAIPYVGGAVQIGAFNCGAWQLLFVLGMTFGHAWATGRRILPERATPLALAAAAGFCAYCFLIRHWYVPAPFENFAAWVNKNNLAGVRLANTLAIFYLVHAAFVRFPRLFRWPALALLGRHSLPVFALHVGVAYVLYAFPQYVSSTLVQTWLGTAIMLGAIFLFAGMLDASARSVAVTPRARADVRG